MITVISFTDPRLTALLKEREEYIKGEHRKLVELLASEFDVYDVMKDMGKYEAEIFGISGEEEVEKAVNLINSKGTAGIVVGLWHWTEPHLVLKLAKATNSPLLLYSADDPSWAGTTCVSAVGASLWESSLTPNMIKHNRVKGNLEEVKRWARGVIGAYKLRRATIILWGGTYSLGMEHLMDDMSALKAMIGDIIIEDQYILVKGAESILEEDRERIERFVGALEELGKGVSYDGKMLNRSILEREVALYLAAKDRVAELSKGREVGGVSIKCQPELSEVYGVDACLIPAFMPFGEDPEGSKPIIPTVCEGDIKGLITSTLLYYISGKPPLFGDLKYVGDGYFMIANCGASSIYYASLSEKMEDNLAKVKIMPQCQGKGGGAVMYRTPPTLLTVARITRVNRKYYMQVLVTESLPFGPEVERGLKWGKEWPHTLLKLKVDQGLFLEAVGSNHFSAIPGDYLKELTYACEELGIRLVRLDNESSIKAFLHEVKRT